MSLTYNWINPPVNKEGARKFSSEEKANMYRLGSYYVPAPPVVHARWTDEDWIRFIDKYGIWIPTNEGA